MSLVNKVGGIPNTARKESEIVRAILAYLKTVPGVVAWRNNVGAVSTGRRFVRFGFPGMSDIIGWQRMCGRCKATPPGRHHTVSRDILGKIIEPPFYHSEKPCRYLCGPNDDVARFFAVECKQPGKQPTPQQAAFLSLVNKAGGLGICAHNVQEVVEALSAGGSNA